jgi:hypothetical protein
MANGKGSLECCYCVHWRGEGQGYDGAYEQGFCDRHKVMIPSTLENWGHRVCADFSPNKFFERDSRVSVEERFAWFGIRLKPGKLYVFSYSSPPEIKELLNLSGKE